MHPRPPPLNSGNSTNTPGPPKGLPRSLHPNTCATCAFRSRSVRASLRNNHAHLLRLTPVFSDDLREVHTHDGETLFLNIFHRAPHNCRTRSQLGRDRSAFRRNIFEFEPMSPVHCLVWVISGHIRPKSHRISSKLAYLRTISLQFWRAMLRRRPDHLAHFGPRIFGRPSPYELVEVSAQRWEYSGDSDRHRPNCGRAVPHLAQNSPAQPRLNTTRCAAARDVARAWPRNDAPRCSQGAKGGAATPTSCSICQDGVGVAPEGTTTWSSVNNPTGTATVADVANASVAGDLVQYQAAGHTKLGPRNHPLARRPARPPAPPPLTPPPAPTHLPPKRFRLEDHG